MSGIPITVCVPSGGTQFYSIGVSYIICIFFYCSYLTYFIFFVLITTVICIFVFSGQFYIPWSHCDLLWTNWMWIKKERKNDWMNKQSTRLQAGRPRNYSNSGRGNRFCSSSFFLPALNPYQSFTQRVPKGVFFRGEISWGVKMNPISNQCLDLQKVELHLYSSMCPQGKLLN